MVLILDVAVVSSRGQDRCWLSDSSLPKLSPEFPPIFGLALVSERLLAPLPRPVQESAAYSLSPLWGLGRIYSLEPSDESLGYFRASLRDWNGDDLTFGHSSSASTFDYGILATFGACRRIPSWRGCGMDQMRAVEQIRGLCNQLSAGVTAIHPWVPKLGNAPAQTEILKALYELTKSVEVIKKHVLKVEKSDSTTTL